MARYDYKCTQCKRKFEAVHGMNAEPLKVCYKCGGDLKRLYSNTHTIMMDVKAKTKRFQ
jgi:putative FmdB family regulatory protein